MASNQEPKATLSAEGASNPPIIYPCKIKKGKVRFPPAKNDSNSHWTFFCRLCLKDINSGMPELIKHVNGQHEGRN